MNTISVIPLLKETISEWLEIKAFRLSAALSYYSLFSIAPLLVIFIAIAGLIFGKDNVLEQVYTQLSDIFGPHSANTVLSMMQSVSNERGNLSATLIGSAILLFGAGGVFGQLKEALNAIWKVKAKPGYGLVRFIRNRFLSFTMVLGTGFLLLVSLIITTLLAAFSKRLELFFPMPAAVWLPISFIISLAVVTTLFAMIFRYLPDVRIPWRDVWTGALFTALLFDLGKFLLSLYLGRESTVSSYGAAGAVIIILLWVYYASMILLLGAEFTRMYARQRGDKIVPKALAVSISPSTTKKEHTPLRK